MSPLKAKNEGQTLVEFIFGLSTVLISVVLGGSILKAQWQRGKCAYLAFENTHAALVGKPQFSISVRIKETDSNVSGEAKCGNIEEKIQFNKL